MKFEIDTEWSLGFKEYKKWTQIVILDHFFDLGYNIW